MVDTLVKVFHWFPGRHRLAIIGSNYRDKTTGRVLCADVVEPSSLPGREMVAVLTSGSLVPVDAFQAIGDFRSEFFIDCVDFEYCLRARRNGFYVLMTSEPVMEHEIGKWIEHRLLWKKVGTTNHAPIRQYFLARNSLVLVREYLCQEPRWILRYFWAWLKSIVPVLLFEKERISKMENIVCGFVDGILGRTDRRPN